jgi:hypothetical protein
MLQCFMHYKYILVDRERWQLSPYCYQLSQYSGEWWGWLEKDGNTQQLLVEKLHQKQRLISHVNIIIFY